MKAAGLSARPKPSSRMYEHSAAPARSPCPGPSRGVRLGSGVLQARQLPSPALPLTPPTCQRGLGEGTWLSADASFAVRAEELWGAGWVSPAGAGAQWAADVASATRWRRFSLTFPRKEVPTPFGKALGVSSLLGGQGNQTITKKSNLHHILQPLSYRNTVPVLRGSTRLCQKFKPRAEAEGWAGSSQAFGSPHAGGTPKHMGEPLEHPPPALDAFFGARLLSTSAPGFRAVVFPAVRGENTAKSSLGLQGDSGQRRDMFIFPVPTSTSNMFSFSTLQKGIFIPPSPTCQQPSLQLRFGHPQVPETPPTPPFSTGRAGWGLMFPLPGTSSKMRRKKTPITIFI